MSNPEKSSATMATGAPGQKKDVLAGKSFLESVNRAIIQKSRVARSRFLSDYGNYSYSILYCKICSF